MTSLLRLIGRPLLASAFIVDGVDALRHPEPHIEAAAPLAEKVNELTGLNLTPKTCVTVSSGVMVAAGVMLASGFFPRLAGLKLAALGIPLAAARSPFWKEKDKEVRSQQRQDFLRSAALAGGALIVAADRGAKGARGHCCGHGHGHGHSHGGDRPAAKQSRRAQRRAAKALAE